MTQAETSAPQALITIPYLPIKDPVLIFLIVLVAILVMPLIAKRLKFPSLIGLILTGVVIGPHGLNVLTRDNSFTLFGTVGMLYIMFLAGLELDLDEFSKKRRRSITFGALTFFIPLILGLITVVGILQYSWLAAWWIASMFSTHTLVAYPIASRLGVTRDEAVAVAVGGTIITDTAVLLLLAVFTGSAEGTLNMMFWIKLIISLSLFGVILFWAFPRIGDWFFKHVDAEPNTHAVFILMMVFSAAFLAQLAGVEAIIGAFASGLALNHLVAHESPLKAQLEFVGNTLFVPFFLIGVGMLVDLKVLFGGPRALIVAVTLTSMALISKWLAAYLTQLCFGYSKIQRNLIFGLSASHAAATLAVILIAYQLKIIDDHVLNGTIVLILVTCLTASFMTERAGRQLVKELQN